MTAYDLWISLVFQSSSYLGQSFCAMLGAVNLGFNRWTDGVVKSPSKENDKAHGFGRFEHVDGDVGETQRTWKTCTGAHFPQWYS